MHAHGLTRCGGRSEGMALEEGAHPPAEKRVVGSSGRQWTVVDGSGL